MINQSSEIPSPQQQVFIGKVKSANGKVVIISETGLQRFVEAGGLVFRNDKVLGQGTETVLEFIDGSQVVLGRQDQVTLTEDVFANESLEQLVKEASTDLDTLQNARSELTNADVAENSKPDQGSTIYTTIERDFAEITVETELVDSIPEEKTPFEQKQQPLIVQDILTEDLVLFNNVNQLVNNQPEAPVEYPLLTEVVSTKGAEKFELRSQKTNEKLAEGASDTVEPLSKRFVKHSELSKTGSKVITEQELIDLYKGSLKKFFVEDVDLKCNEVGELTYIKEKNSWKFTAAPDFSTDTLSIKLLVTITDGNKRDELTVKYSVGQQTLSVVEQNPLPIKDLIVEKDGAEVVFSQQPTAPKYVCSGSYEASVTVISSQELIVDNNQYDI
ncbi:hypothetical protein [Spartinivicinus ruber]|uniref:hypothetical protein n=1 Tax=Spartinivicinus ruber TaxID=2683272 RepID=UPI0013D353B1|nr:hypothetical protein [Spartinivicinus ruber]